MFHLINRLAGKNLRVEIEKYLIMYFSLRQLHHIIVKKKLFC